MRNLSIFIGIVLMIGGCASSPNKKNARKLSSSDKSMAYVAMANGAIREREFAKAFKDLAEAQKISGITPEILHTRALAYHFSGQKRDAVMEVLKAIRMKPSHHPANLTYGKFLLDQRKFKKSLIYLKRAAAEPTFNGRHKAMTAIGMVYFRMKQYKNADEAFKHAIASSPMNSCLSHYYRGHIALKRKQFKQSALHYDRAAGGICGGFKRAHYAKGVALMKNKKFDLARKKFLEVQKLFPASREAKKSIKRLKEMP